MNSVLIMFLFVITNNGNYAKECHRVPRAGATNEEENYEEETTTTDVATTRDFNDEELKELLQNKTVESAAILISKLSKQASDSSNSFKNSEDVSKIELNKAYTCSKMECSMGDKMSPVCACNFNTGNVASFKNKCDAQKHNCRFDTNFKVILDEICPWEFASRRSNKEFEFDYRDAKYYN